MLEKIVSLTFFPILASNKIFKPYWVVLASISWVFLTCLAMKIQTKTRIFFYLRTFCYNWKMKPHIYLWENMFRRNICVHTDIYLCILIFCERNIMPKLHHLYRFVLPVGLPLAESITWWANVLKTREEYTHMHTYIYVCIYVCVFIYRKQSLS